MAVHPSVPTGLSQAPCGTKPWYTITTEGPVHFRMLLWFTQPRGNWLFVTHRGQRRKRKFIIQQQPDLCIDQLEPDASITHTWVLPQGAPGAHVWVAWSETCLLRVKQPASPPIRLTYQSCSGSGSYASVGGFTTDAFSPIVNVRIPVGPLIEGNPNMYDAVNNWTKAAGAGTYSISAYATLQNREATSDASGFIQIRNLGNGQGSSPQFITLPRNGPPLKVSAAWQTTVGITNPALTLFWFNGTGPVGGIRVLENFAYISRS